MNVRKYVVGFILSKDRTKVLLIRKSRPAWQVDKYNGIGGLVNDNENSIVAMIRECREETGLDITSWNSRGQIMGDTHNVTVFLAITSIEDMMLAQSFPTTDEPLRVFSLTELDTIQTIPQLTWLIPMVLDSEVINFNIRQPDK